MGAGRLSEGGGESVGRAKFRALYHEGPSLLSLARGRTGRTMTARPADARSRMDFDSRLGRNALRKLKRERVVWLTRVDE